MILFSDFDRTLYFRDNDDITASNIGAVEEWRNAGNLFCITTGRSYKSVTAQMPQIKNLCDYYIVDGGSIILSKGGKVINAVCFESIIVEDIVKFSETLSEKPILIYYTPSSEGADHAANNVTKLRLWFNDIKILHEVSERLMEKFPVFTVFTSDLHVRQNHDGLENCNGFVEAVPLESGKNNAIKFLTQKIGISFNNIVTVGDGFNDYNMIKDYDGFVIEGSELSNADAQLKTVASLATLIDDKLR